MGIPGYWGYSHGATVGVSTIWRTIGSLDPLLEFPTKGVYLITVGEVFEEVDKRVFRVPRIVHEPLGDGEREDRVVGIGHALQHFHFFLGSEFLHFLLVFLEFVFRAEHFTTDATDEASLGEMFRSRAFHSFDGDVAIRCLGETKVTTQPVDVGTIEQVDVGRLAAQPLLPLGVPFGTIAVEFLFAVMRITIAICQEVADDVLGVVEVSVFGDDDLSLFLGGFRTIVEMGHQTGGFDITEMYPQDVNTTADGVEVESIGIGWCSGSQ